MLKDILLNDYKTVEHFQKISNIGVASFESSAVKIPFVPDITF